MGKKAKVQLAGFERGWIDVLLMIVDGINFLSARLRFSIPFCRTMTQ